MKTAQIISLSAERASRAKRQPSDPVAEMWIAYLDFWMALWVLR